MSFTEVIDELPKLTRQQRRELELRLFEINNSAQEAEDIALCEHSAVVGFALLDAMEAEDRSR